MKVLGRCNPKLTGNVKLVIYNGELYLDSIDSTPTMASSSLKMMKYNKAVGYGVNLKRFAARIPVHTDMFAIKPEQPQRRLSANEDIYTMGVRSDTSRMVEANFRFFCPIYIDGGDVPDSMIAVKIDRSLFVSGSIGGDIVSVMDFKTLGVYDVLKSHIEWVRSLESGIYVDYSESISVSGIDLSTGSLGSVIDCNVSDLLLSERTITETEMNLTTSYERAGMVDPRYLNLEFCFDMPKTGKFDDVACYLTNHKVLDINNPLCLAVSDSVRVVPPTTIPQRYSKSVAITSAIGVGSEYKSTVTMTMGYSPSAGSMFRFAKNGIEVVSYMVSPEDLIDYNTILTNITNKLNGVFSRMGSYNETAKIYDGKLVIEGDSLTITEIPSTFSFVDVESFDGFNRVGLMLPVDNKCAVFSTKIKIKENAISTLKSNGITAKILAQFQRFDSWVIVTDSVISKSVMGSTRVEFLSDASETLVSLYPIDINDFDFDRLVSDYSDVYDFNLNDFRNYLLTTVNADYLGKYKHTSTDPQTIAVYKDVVRDMVNRYFDSIGVQPTQSLIRSVNTTTFESELCVNEYDRLAENTQTALDNISKVIPYINKFAHRDGTDVYGNPYRFNVSLPFRFDGYTPSIRANIRDIRYHTHGWLTICEGKPPYITGLKTRGYSSKQLVLTDFISVTENAHNFLPVTNTVKVRNGIGIVFHRGIRLVVPSKYEGYSFASVLLTRTPPDGTDIRVGLIENPTFKTLTLLVNQYIPEPILTGLEDPDVYFLDRSLLYYSGGDNSTEVKLKNFGEGLISLSIFETSKPKFYAGASVGTNWIANTPDGVMFWVGKGDTSRFNTPMTEIISSGDVFETFYAGTNELEHLKYGMKVRFEGITSIANDYFWCTDIKVKYKDIQNWETETLDDDSVTDVWVSVKDSYNTLGESMFTKMNIIAILGSLLYNNSKYLRVLKNRFANDRYLAISTSSIVSRMTSSPLPLVIATGVESFDMFTATQNNQRILVSPPDEVHVVVSLEYTDKISKLGNSYAFPMLRCSGYYDPLIKPYITFDANRFVVSDSNIYKYGIKTNNVITTKFPALSPYMGYEWGVDADEVVDVISRVMNTDDIINLHTTNVGVVSVYELLKPYITKLLIDSGVTFEEQGILDSLWNFTNTPLDGTIGKDDVIMLYLKRFYENTFSILYYVDSVERNGLMGFVDNHDGTINITDDEQTGDINIVIKRM